MNIAKIDIFLKAPSKKEKIFEKGLDRCHIMWYNVFATEGGTQIRVRGAFR